MTAPKAQKQKAATREKDVRTVCQQEGCMGAAAGGQHRGRQRGTGARAHSGPGGSSCHTLSAATGALVMSKGQIRWVMWVEMKSLAKVNHDEDLSSRSGDGERGGTRESQEWGTSCSPGSP